MGNVRSLGNATEAKPRFRVEAEFEDGGSAAEFDSYDNAFSRFCRLHVAYGNTLLPHKCEVIRLYVGDDVRVETRFSGWKGKADV